MTSTAGSLVCGPARSTSTSPSPARPGMRSTATGASATSAATRSIIRLTPAGACVGLSVRSQVDRCSRVSPFALIAVRSPFGAGLHRARRKKKRRASPRPACGERPTRAEPERVRGCRRRSAIVDSPSPSPPGTSPGACFAASPRSPLPAWRGEVTWREVTWRSARLRHGDGDEAGAFLALDAQQHRGLPGLVRRLEPGLDVGRLRHRLAADLEDDVALLDALLDRRPIRVDGGDGDAFALARRGKLEAELRQAVIAARRRRLRLLLARLGGERDRRGALLAVAKIGDLGLGAGLQRADLAGELARVGDRLAVDRGDHVAGLEARLLGRRAVLRARDERALLGRDAEALGQLLRQRLDLHAEIAPADPPVLLQLVDDRLNGRGRHREGEADAAAGGRVDRRVHADTGG